MYPSREEQKGCKLADETINSIVCTLSVDGNSKLLLLGCLTLRISLFIVVEGLATAVVTGFDAELSASVALLLNRDGMEVELLLDGFLVEEVVDPNAEVGVVVRLFDLDTVLTNAADILGEILELVVLVDVLELVVLMGVLELVALMEFSELVVLMEVFVVVLLLSMHPQAS